MNRKISLGMAVTIVILAMTVTFSITMLLAMRLFDSTVSSVKEKESMYNKLAEVDRYVRGNDYYDIDETVLYDRLSAGYLLGTGDKYARYYTASAYTDLINVQNGTLLGIGVELAIDQSGYAKVTKVYTDSPARKRASKWAITSPLWTAMMSRACRVWKPSRPACGASPAPVSMSLGWTVRPRSTTRT